MSQQATATETGLKSACASSRLQEGQAKLPGELAFPHWHGYWDMPWHVKLQFRGSGSLVLPTTREGEARILQWRSTTYRKEKMLGLGFFTLTVIPTHDSNLRVFRFSAEILNYQSLSFLWLLFSFAMKESGKEKRRNKGGRKRRRKRESVASWMSSRAGGQVPCARLWWSTILLKVYCRGLLVHPSRPEPK